MDILTVFTNKREKETNQNRPERNGEGMKQFRKQKRVIPGFGLTLGITVSMLSVIVLIPLLSLIIYTAKLSWREFLEVVTAKRVLYAFWVSVSTSFIASFVNAVMGLTHGNMQCTLVILCITIL